MGCATAPFSVAPGSAPAPEPTEALSVELDFGSGQVARFSGGEDIGTFVGEFVRQRCFLATDPAFPDWRVMFRPDVDGTRDEVVVEYGRAVGGTPANRMTPYTATIRKGDTVVYAATVPTHWWDARWRWQSAPRPVVRTPAVLTARGWIPKLGTAGLFGRAPYTYTGAHDGPMTIPAHMTTGMGAAGENQMIGHLTESAAEYVIRGGDNCLTTARVEAEAVGTWAIHTRLADGSMPDVAGQDLHYKGTKDGATINEPPRIAHAEYMALAESHWFPCANLPYLLTDDPYLLEELQFGVNWRLLYNSYARINKRNPSLIIQQARSWGWALRDQRVLALSTPDVTPKWLQPRATWTRQLDDNLRFAMTYVDSGSAMAQTFRCWLRFDVVAPWMNSFINASMGMLAKDFPEWKRAFAWGVYAHIAQLDGKSGWDPRMPTPYLWSVTANQAIGANGWPTVPNPTLETAAFKTWKEASDWLANEKFPGEDPATWGDEPKVIGQSYALQTRAALVLAVEHGVPDAAMCLERLEGYIRRLGWDGMARFAFVGVE